MLFYFECGNLNGTVTLEEFVAAAEVLFKECDKDGKGSLGESAVSPHGAVPKERIETWIP
jgi:hypothetical protein